MNKIMCGDALDTLKTLPSGIVQTCVTSPPYYGLRDYGVLGQIGMEETPEMYVSRLVEVFREVKRVLRDDGTLWLNLGDSYAGSGGNHGQGTYGENRWKRGAYIENTAKPPTENVMKNSTLDLKPKDLIGIPWMLAFALRADGWYLRADLIWHKPNCMPESVTDRPTKAHEYIFLLSKQERYYYDADAIAERSIRPGDIQTFGGNKGRNYTPAEDDPNYRYGKEQWGRTITMGNTRNKRSVWTVSTMPYSEAHFATFPPKLIEPCILAGTSPQACEHCGAPWERVTEREQSPVQPYSDVRHTPAGTHKKIGSVYQDWLNKHPKATTGWQPTCTCDNTGSGSCVVLDPFCGAGTVPLVALKYQRQYIGIELNQSYIDLALKRIETVQPVLWEVVS